MSKLKHTKNTFLKKIRELNSDKLSELLEEKQKELRKHEYSARGASGGYGGSVNRMAYSENNKFMIKELRKQIAQIKTIIKEKGG